MSTILAVAIGDPSNSRNITDLNGVTGVRPYIRGLTDYLSQSSNYTIGQDYTINYQECYEDDEDFSGPADVIFCMSTPVVRKAVAFTPVTPIVGVFSDPTGEGFDKTQNVCGVNAQRIQNAREYYERFVHTVSGLSAVYILHKVGNTASNGCLAGIKKGALSVPIATLDVTTAPNHDIQTLINGVPNNSGLLVLPVDLFFGAMTFILQLAAAKSLKVFWPSPDGVPSSIASYGVSQYDCGQLMGKQVKYIFDNKGIPLHTADRFVNAPKAKWVASKAVAKALNVELREHRELHLM